MEQLITGIHHITVIASNAQKIIDFYTGILGMRLVKKTVNFDTSQVAYYLKWQHGAPALLYMNRLNIWAKL
jgi:glyoxalase family protein